MRRCVSKILGEILFPKASSHGVPSPTHVSKSQYMATKSQLLSLKRPLKFVLYSLKLDLDYLWKQSWDLCWHLGLALYSTQSTTQVQVSPPKSVAMQASLSFLGLRSWELGHVWSGKSQLPCSQRLRLHGLTSGTLRLWTCEPALGLMCLNWTQQEYGHLYLSGMWVGVDLRIGIKKGLFKRDWTTCSKYASRSRPNSQLGGGLYDHWMSTRIFTLIIIKVLIWTPKLWSKWLHAQYSSIDDLALDACSTSYK